MEVLAVIWGLMKAPSLPLRSNQSGERRRMADSPVKPRARGVGILAGLKG